MEAIVDRGFSASDFGEIRRPGAYVLVGTAHLLSVAPGALTSDGSPAVSVAGHRPLLVCPVSYDPWVRIGEARKLAADMDIDVDF